MVGCLAHNQNSAGSTPVSAITTKTTMRVIDETDLGAKMNFHHPPPVAPVISRGNFN